MQYPPYPRTTVPATHTSRDLSARGTLSRVLGLAALGAFLTATPASAQTTFSIDYKGPTSGVVNEGDLLIPAPGFPGFGPLPLPGVMIPGGGGPGTLGLPLYGACLGHPPGIACGTEVDAMSYGFDTRAKPAMPPGSFYFSVETMALGFPTGFPAPDVMSESGVLEAGADVFADLGLGPAPLPPFGSPPGNAAVIDGDGLPLPSAFTYPGLGLIEPTAGVCVLPEPGDNVDAIDIDGPSVFPVYFSLDSAFPDAPCGFPLGGSAMANGPFFGGDILISFGLGGPPVVWAGAPALGLDLFGPDTDDLDALAIWENGSGAWENALSAYGWAAGLTDMVIFSVREGSAIIGTPDSLLGIPIEAGDLLIPPAIAGATPQMFIAAENLGLATFRSGFPLMDDLDALDILVPTIPPLDLTGAGIPTNVLIALGIYLDCNGNLIPDFLESTSYCTAGTSASGCMAVLSACGVPSATAPTGFTMMASGVEGLKDGLFFYGTNGRQANAWGNGTSYQCVVPPVKRGGLLTGVGTIGSCDGTFAQDLNARWTAKPSHNPGLGSVLQVQFWYRDPFNTSNQTTSLSDALEFVVGP